MLHRDVLDSIFSDSSIIDSVSNYVVWTGGEPFENFSSLLYGVSLAKRSGFRSEILTSGYWHEKDFSHLKKLQESGDFSIRISIDHEHLMLTKTNKIIALISECINSGIDVNFTVRKIDDHNNKVSKFFELISRAFPDYYKEKGHDHRWIHFIPHVPVAEDDPYSKNCNMEWNGYTGCKMVGRDLVVGMDGNIYPCCGLFSLPDFSKYSVGTVNPSGKVKNRYSGPKELFEIIRTKGPEGVRSKFPSEGSKMGISGFCNQCHACISMLRSYKESIDEYFQL